MEELATESQGVLESRNQLCTFRLSNRLFGVDILDVKEINTEVDFCPIRHAKEEVKGYVNIRGQIHLVLDLRLLLGFNAEEIGPDNRVLIFKPHVGETFGVLVDKIGDIVAVTPEQIEERTDQNEEQAATRDRHRHLIRGECKLDDKLIIVLNPKNFLPAIEIMH